MNSLFIKAIAHLDMYVPGMSLSAFARREGADIETAAKLASNENPLGPSRLALHAVQGALQSMHLYPDGAGEALRARIAVHLGVQENQVILGNGSNELIELIVRACVEPHENIVTAKHAFMAYGLAARAADREFIEAPMRALTFDAEAILNAVNARTKLVFIANPNNPTGTYMNVAELDDLLKRLPEEVFVIVDEAYFEYSMAGDYPNTLERLPNRHRLMVLRTFSKCYGLAGLRVGYGIAAADIIGPLNRVRQPFNTNVLGQIAAKAALDDIPHVEKSRRGNQEEMLKLQEGFMQLGIKTVLSQANFLLACFGHPAAPMHQHLLADGLITRPMGAYSLPECLRISVGLAADNDRVLRSVAQGMNALRS